MEFDIQASKETNTKVVSQQRLTVIICTDATGKLF